MYTKRTLLSLAIAIFVAFRPTEVVGGRAKPAVRRGDFSTSTLSPTLPSPSVVGRRGFGRFHANDSLVGRLVPCTADEKVCFRYNMLFNSKADRCQPLGHEDPTGCRLTSNRTEYERGTGHIYGVCNKYQDPCPGHRMAYDGRCYRKKIARDVICGCGAEPTRHFLGGVECRCSPTPPATVEQPTRVGRCYIPDFRFPVDLSSKFKVVVGPPLRAPAATTKRPEAPKNVTEAPANRRESPTNQREAPANQHEVPANQHEAQANQHEASNTPDHTSRPSCSPEQKKCFAIGHVWVASRGGGGCFPLLQRGPCAKDEVVVLSRDEWVRRPAECRHLAGGCPPGQRRMAFDGRCHDAREMELVAPGRIALDIFGEFEVMDFKETRSHLPRVFNGTCVVFSSSSMAKLPPPEKRPKAVCTPGNEDLCAVYNEISDLPPPEYDYFDDNGIS